MSINIILYSSFSMTLSRITERIAEDKQKKGKIDGRRFNSRSQKKMMWQVKDIQRGIRKISNHNHRGRGGYSKEELEEYKEINKKERAESEIRLIVKQTLAGIVDEIGDNI